MLGCGLLLKDYSVLLITAMYVGPSQKVHCVQVTRIPPISVVSCYALTSSRPITRVKQPPAGLVLG